MGYLWPVKYLYTGLVYGFRLISHVAAIFNPKMRQAVAGRRNLSGYLAKHFPSPEPVVWFHCASLGEFEQGRPVIEALKKEFPTHKILLTFFSPSGYEVRKNYESADFVSYIPWDTPAACQQFVARVRPTAAIFVKYEFWPNLLLTLADQKVPVISISAIFRPGQHFFQWYGGFFRKTLQTVQHFFVQNEQSRQLLLGLGISPITVSGDTRFDRVQAVVQTAGEIEIARKFKGSDKVMVIGSCWPDDLEVLTPFIHEQKGRLKFIIAPHELSEAGLQKIEKEIAGRPIRYSRVSAGIDLENYQVLIIDNVGMLARLYRYGEFAFVGGAFGDGLHNILEAACYGIPIFFGNRNYDKFQEAHDLINRGGAFAVGSYPELKMQYEAVSEPENYLLACEVCRSYVEQNLGATEKIMAYCRKLLST